MLLWGHSIIYPRLEVEAGRGEGPCFCILCRGWAKLQSLLAPPRLAARPSPLHTRQPNGQAPRLEHAALPKHACEVQGRVRGEFPQGMQLCPTPMQDMPARHNWSHAVKSQFYNELETQIWYGNRHTLLRLYPPVKSLFTVSGESLKSAAEEAC